MQQRAGTMVAATSAGSTWLVGPVVESMDRGVMLRRIAAGALWIAAAFMIVGTTALVVSALGVIPEMTGALRTGTLIQSAVLVLTAVAVALLLVARARTALERGLAPFAAAPLVGLWVRTAGEALAMIHVGVGISGAAFTWFSGGHSLYLFREFELVHRIPSLGVGALPGLGFLGLSLATGAGFLLAGHLAAEFLTAGLCMVRQWGRLHSPFPSVPDGRALGAMEALAHTSISLEQPAVFCTGCGTQTEPPNETCVACTAEV